MCLIQRLVINCIRFEGSYLIYILWDNKFYFFKLVWGNPVEKTVYNIRSVPIHLTRLISCRKILFTYYAFKIVNSIYI